jgi:hypothetical protein
LARLTQRRWKHDWKIATVGGYEDTWFGYLGLIGTYNPGVVGHPRRSSEKVARRMYDAHNNAALREVALLKTVPSLISSRAA